MYILYMDTTVGVDG